MLFDAAYAPVYEYASVAIAAYTADILTEAVGGSLERLEGISACSGQRKKTGAHLGHGT